MKRHAFWIFLSLLGLVWLLMSCDDAETCETPATVIELPGCGLGFELANGKQLKPVADVIICFPSPNNPLYSSYYVVGQKVLIGYERSKSDYSCGNAKPINLLCLQALDEFDH
jgi:hypothetical protein